MSVPICLEEIDGCLRTSTSVGFVFLSTERYGWRALPQCVSDKQMSSLLSALPERSGARQAFKRWYLRDENASPPLYVLQRVSKLGACGHAFWDDVAMGVKGDQRVMQEAVWEAEQAAPDLVPREIWSVSITEREVVAGLQHNLKHVQSNGLCIIRTIEGLSEAIARDPESAAAAFGAVEENEYRMVNALRARLRTTLPPVDVREYVVPWGEQVRFEQPPRCPLRLVTAPAERFCSKPGRAFRRPSRTASFARCSPTSSLI